jgi:hypothetical protein
MLIFKKLSSHKLEFTLFVLIFAIGIGLRTYNHSNWLHFEVDQTWDFQIVSNAIEKGPGELPLLGPTAGGGRALRLGPAFYYMEYASALVFGNTPVGHSMLVLIFSLLAIPLFYLFVKRYFSVYVSLGILLIFSISLYLILYSRFSWSPNVLPFLMLLSLYSLLKSVSLKEKNAKIWFLIMIGAVTITTQIHFNAFFILPAIVISFLIIKRPKFNFKTWLCSLAIILVLYSPVIANEIKTGGENSSFFIKKLDKKETHYKPFLEKLVLTARYNAYEYFLIISGNDQINEGSPPDGYNMGLACKKSCTDRLPYRIPALFYFTLAIFLLVKRTKKEIPSDRKDFLILTLLWFIFSFLYFYAIFASNILFPRFFLVVSPLAIILLGLIFETINPEKNKLRFGLFVLIILFLSYMNLKEVFNYFENLRNAPTTETTAEMKDVFPDNKRVTLQQEKMLADYMASKYALNNYPVYISCDHEYEPSFWYFLNQKNIFYYNKFHAELTSEKIYTQANYFAIFRTNQIVLFQDKNISSNFTIIEEKRFGSLTVFYLNPLVEKNTAEIQNNNEKAKTLQTQQISELLTWNKLTKPLQTNFISDKESFFDLQQ